MTSADAPGGGEGWHLGKLASTAMHSLASNPLLLGLVGLNALLLVLFYWSANDTRQRNSEILKTVIEHCSIKGAQLKKQDSPASLKLPPLLPLPAQPRSN